MIPVTNHHRVPANLSKYLSILRGERGKLSDGGIFFEYDFTIVVCIYFQWVTISNDIDTDGYDVFELT